MAYTEVKERNRKKYYYRVLSFRKGKTVSKLRRYLGVNLRREELLLREREADKGFSALRLHRKSKAVERIKKQILGILRKHRITKAGIFGSYARGEGRKDSDIDILIEARRAWVLGL